MRTSGLLLALILAACFKPTLDTCAGLACPAGKLCVVGASGPGCIPIARCDQLAAGATCELGTGQEATCQGGACVAVERCGNGVLESGEACDCGDPEVPLRAECNLRNNSIDDPLAPCRTDCSLRSCGDGVRDANEQCEGETLAPNLTCGTFGYYEGELACSSLCIVDTSACAGRCGDGIVDSANEFCDVLSTEPVSRMCTDFGYATGRLGCTSLCGPSFTDCRDGTAFVELLPLRTDLVELVPGPTAGEAWLAVTNGIMRYTPTGFVTYPALTSSVLDISSHGGRAAVSLYDGSVVIYEASGVVTTLAAPARCVQVVLTGPTTLACLTVGGAVWWDGAAWGTLLPGPVASDAIARPDGTVMYTKYDGHTPLTTIDTDVFVVSQSSITPMGGWTDMVEHFAYLPSGQAPTTGGYYGGLAYGSAEYGVVHLAEGTQQWSYVYGTQNVRSLASAGGLTMWFGAVGHSVRLPNRIATTLDGTQRECKRFVEVGASALCLTRTYQKELWRFAGATIGQLVPTGISPLGDMIAAGDTFYFLSTTGAGASSPSVGWSPPDADFRTFIGARDGKLAIASAPNVGKIAHGQPGSWRTHTFANAIRAMAIAPADHVVVAHQTTGGCDVVDWNAVDDSVAVLATGIPCPTTLWVSPTNHVWAASATGVYDITLGSMSLNVPPGAAVLSGIDDQHLWFASSGSIWFWDGKQWTSQLTEPSALFDWISATADGVIASSGGAARTTWTLTGVEDGIPSWVKLRLPSDQTPMIKPQLQPWGVVYRTTDNTVQFAAWQDGWAR